MQTPSSPVLITGMHPDLTQLFFGLTDNEDPKIQIVSLLDELLIANGGGHYKMELRSNTITGFVVY